MPSGSLVLLLCCREPFQSDLASAGYLCRFPGYSKGLPPGHRAMCRTLIRRSCVLFFRLFRKDVVAVGSWVMCQCLKSLLYLCLLLSLVQLRIFSYENMKKG